MIQLKSTTIGASAFLTLALACFTQSSTVVADSNGRASLAPIETILPYYDEDYGFELAVPQSWSRIITIEDDTDENELEPGYAVGFESPRSSSTDVYADYLMVEILPGAHSGAFETDGSQSQVVMVDGRVAVTDRVNLDGFDIYGNEIDLVVFQAEIVELGFTVGIFAIGEQREAAVLADAFNLALKTFKVPDDPFSVS